MTAQFVTADRFHPNILDKLGIKVNGGNHQEPVRRRKEVLFSFSRLPESELDLRGCGPLFLPFRCLGEKGGTVLNGTNHRLNVSNGAVKVVECRGAEPFPGLLRPTRRGEFATKRWLLRPSRPPRATRNRQRAADRHTSACIAITPIRSGPIAVPSPSALNRTGATTDLERPALINSPAPPPPPAVRRNSPDCRHASGRLRKSRTQAADRSQGRHGNYEGPIPWAGEEDPSVVG